VAVDILSLHDALLINWILNGRREPTAGTRLWNLNPGDEFTVDGLFDKEPASVSGGWVYAVRLAPSVTGDYVEVIHVATGKLKVIAGWTRVRKLEIQIED
jgi:hypothetical protein